MNPSKRATMASCALAAAGAVCVAAGVAFFGLGPHVAEQASLLLVVFMALWNGAAPAVVAALTAVLMNHVMLRLPPDAPGLSTDVIEFAVFTIIGLITAWLGAANRRRQLMADAAAEAERRARMERDDVLAMVSHDLLNPLNVIKGSVQHARRTAGGGDVQRSLRRAENAADRALDLARCLRDLRAIDERTFALEIAPSDLRLVVAEVVDRMTGISEKHSLTCEVPADHVPAMFDEPRLQSVLENVIGNAIKYSPQGGPIQVALALDDGAARISVTDHGVGIPADAQDHVFERNFRAANAPAAARGSGLGLFISAEVVKLHGGSIRVDDTPGGGATFTISLPAYPSDSSRGALGDPQHKPFGRPLGASPAARRDATGA
jgi:signal transduction histidine kinase